MKKEINHKWFFNHPPEMVWNYLTKPELLSLWLMDNNIKPVLGHKFQFRSNPAKEIGYDGVVDCEILDVIDYRKLSYSWKCGPDRNTIKLDSIVIWTLISSENGTELVLNHTGFNEDSTFYLPVNKGWEYHADKLSQALNKNK